ncbi:MAG: signal peptidase II [bacterium]|nr:signal peptidase II [bacterium]
MYKYKKTIYFFIFSFLIFLDQISKYIIRTKGGFYICNKDLAFGLSPYIIISAILLITLFLFIYNFKFKIGNLIRNWKPACRRGRLEIRNLNKINLIATILILSGGISNIIDRLCIGCVIDFIDLKFWPVFNLADIYITIGVITILIVTMTKDQ